MGFEAKAGKCETHCANLPIFLCVFFIIIIFTFMAGTPITVSILRYVVCWESFIPKTTCWWKANGLGVHLGFILTIGSIPIYPFKIISSVALDKCLHRTPDVGDLSDMHVKVSSHCLPGLCLVFSLLLSWNFSCELEKCSIFSITEIKCIPICQNQSGRHSTLCIRHCVIKSSLSSAHQ